MTMCRPRIGITRLVLSASWCLLIVQSVAFLYPIHRRHSSMRLNMSVQQTEDLPESTKRRKLLLSSLLATSGSSTLISTSSIAQEDGTTPNLRDDWSDPNIMKPPLDDRDYVAYIMENGLRVILCSDPTSNEGGAAMDVHVGATSDPPEVNGLAHFCEHMLFLGTKQYPKEDSFENYLSKNGGSSNAYTDSENTVYFFTMEAEADTRFAEGLSRFGSFFSSPLFTPSATGRELNAIESEHAKNLQSDSFRIYQLEKSRQSSDHPHSRFFTGNKRTLLDDTKLIGLDLREELINFYDKYYSANQMTLAVVGPQSIDELRAMADKAFAEIPDKRVAKPEEAWNRIIPPYGGDSKIPSFHNIVKVVPVQDLRQLSMMWPIVYADEGERTNALLTKQANYVAHLLGHEGPGSLLSHLKRQGWANSLASAGGSELSDYEMFEVTVSLSMAGLAAVDQVVEAVFSYIGMLRERVIPKYVYEEVLQLEELQWRYLPKSATSGYLQSLSTSLQKYPASLCVAGPRRLALALDEQPTLESSSKPRGSFSSKSQFDLTRKLSLELVNKLTVDNALLTVLSTTFQGQTNAKEPIYGTDYRCDPIPEATLNRWRNPIRPELCSINFPTPNVFIPSEGGLRVKVPPIEIDRFRKRTFEERLTPNDPPRIIRDDGSDGKWTVYYKPDSKFGQPKAYVIVELFTKEVYGSPENAALAALYETCAIDKLAESAYDAGLAGLTYDVKVLPRGLRLSFGGYNDKLAKFASYVSEKVRNILPTNDVEFERYKDENSRGLAAFDVRQPYAHCSYYSNLFVQPRRFQYSNKEMRAATERSSLDDLKSYVNMLWSSGKAIALIQGNLDESEAISLVKNLDQTLSFRPISKDDFPPQLKPLPLPPVAESVMPTRLMISEPNPSNSNSAAYAMIQDLSESPKDHVMMELIGSIFQEPFYQDLRTQKQLGYIVSSGIRANGKTRYLGFVVQSSVATTDKLTSEILNFLDKARNTLLEKLPDAELAVLIKSLIDRKTEPDKTLTQEVTRNWAEISSERLEFDRVQREAAALLDVTKEDLLEFWDNVYVKDGRRLLVTEIVPRYGVTSSATPPLSTGYTFTKGATGSNQEAVVLGIDDIERFREVRESKAY